MVKVRGLVRLAATVFLCILGIYAPASAKNAGAIYHSEARYLGKPDLGLAAALVRDGGGPANFDSARLVRSLTGPLFDAEVKKLTKQYGEKNVKSFLATFTYSIRDVLRLAKLHGVVLPSAPPEMHGKTLARALYRAGIMPSGRFDIGYMLEHAISRPLHIALMRDINTNPSFGPRVNENFHIVLTQAVKDLHAAYGP